MTLGELIAATEEFLDDLEDLPGGPSALTLASAERLVLLIHKFKKEVSPR